MFLSRSLQATLMLCATALFTVANAASSLEPPNGKRYLGAWLDTNPVSPGSNIGKDSPPEFNQRLGYNASFFQFAMNIPVDRSMDVPTFHITNTSTDAILYLTVYPTATNFSAADLQSMKAYDMLTPAAINDFVEYIGELVKSGFRLFLRLIPEMNGNWLPWGQRPVHYVAFWQSVYKALAAANLSNSVALIWAPGFADNYPFGGHNSTIFNSDNKTNATLVDPSYINEFNALDTNKDGVFDSKDDAYSPFYPGDEYVDWIGASAYYFGVVSPWLTNTIPAPGQFISLLTSGTSDLYHNYSAARNKPFFIAETGTAYFVNQIKSATTEQDLPAPVAIAPGPGALAMKQAYWQQYITNRTFLEAYPNIKAICLFEFQKDEEETFRDFQLTNSSNSSWVLNAFKADMNGVQDLYTWANYTSRPPNTSAPRSANAASSMSVVSAWATWLLAGSAVACALVL